MPGWHRETAKLREEGKLNTIGIVQEQHPDRTRLFQQWQQMEWPVVVDSLDLLGVTVVPIHVLVDRHGVVRGIARSADPLEKFLAEEFPDSGAPPAAVIPDRDQLQSGAGEDARRWRDLGDAAFLWGEPSEAIDAYSRSIQLDPNDAAAHFRLGVALRRRYETENRHSDDFSAAVTAWTDALDRTPGNYIWRRRIQQYGPQLAKPYPFYDWVEQARADISARGETPVTLIARLTDSERIGPKEAAGVREAMKHPDPDGKLPRDELHFVQIEPALAPARAEAGAPVRMHLLFRPDEKREVHWNNEVGPLALWFEVPNGWKITPQVQLAPRAKQVESTELRALECEITPPSGLEPGRTTLRGFATYPVCEGEGGTCRFLRQDFTVEVETVEKAR